MIEILHVEFAQYQVISIDHRRDFIPKVDNFPLRILGNSGTFTSIPLSFDKAVWRQKAYWKKFDVNFLFSVIISFITYDWIF